VLAAVEAFILYRLLFGKDLTRAREVTPQPLRAEDSVHGSVTAAAAAHLCPPPAELRAALVHALAFVIWQAGRDADGRSRGALVTCDAGALPCSISSQAASFAVSYFSDFRALEAAVAEALPQFETESGVVLLMFAVVMARGVDTVRVRTTAGAALPSYSCVGRQGMGLTAAALPPSSTLGDPATQ
jgi:hypothetical protein